MVRNVRESERVYIQESEHRKQRAREERQARQRPATSPPQNPQALRERQYAKRKQILRPRARIDGPSRIDERQVRRPKQLSQIEPDHTPCQQTPFQQRERELRAIEANELPLYPGRDDSPCYR